MSIEVLVAIIGGIAMVLTAWITTRARKDGKTQPEKPPVEIVGRDKIGGDSVGRDKFESHENLYLGDMKERKSLFAYIIEKFFVFVFTAAISGVIFGGIGALVSQGLAEDPEPGIAIGIVIALIAGFVNAANVKRTKGLG